MSATAPVVDEAVIRANKLELIERLADDLAHEIKNPLHSMVINLEVLKRRAARAGGADDAGLLRYFDVLAAELERVNRRAELLLRLARPARDAEPTTLDALLGQLIELIELEARRHGATLVYEPREMRTRIRVSASLARQAILDLVLDALASGAAQGATLRLALQDEDDASRLTVSISPTRDGAPSGYLDAARQLAEACGARVKVCAPAADRAEAGATLRIPAFHG